MAFTEKAEQLSMYVTFTVVRILSSTLLDFQDSRDKKLLWLQLPNRKSCDLAGNIMIFAKKNIEKPDINKLLVRPECCYAIL